MDSGQLGRRSIAIGVAARLSSELLVLRLRLGLVRIRRQPMAEMSALGRLVGDTSVIDSVMLLIALL